MIKRVQDEMMICMVLMIRTTAEVLDNVLFGLGHVVF